MRVNNRARNIIGSILGPNHVIAKYVKVILTAAMSYFDRGNDLL